MSGSHLSFWARSKRPLEQFRLIAAIAQIDGANSMDTGQIADILRTRSALELIQNASSVYTFHRNTPVFRPVVEGQWDGAFITQNPEVVWESGRYQHRPFLTGFTYNEGAAFADLVLNETKLAAIREDLDYAIGIGAEIPLAVVPEFRQHYFGNSGLTDDKLDTFLRVSFSGMKDKWIRIAFP